MEIILPIKPKYTKKIFTGEKKYEFRKRKPKRTIISVIIYETSPSKSLVGQFIVKRIIANSPKEIWELCKNSSGMEEKEFFTYCNNKKIIYAFEIDSVLQYNVPMNPITLFPNFKPPQNFLYTNKLKEKLYEKNNSRHRNFTEKM